MFNDRRLLDIIKTTFSENMAAMLLYGRVAKTIENDSYPDVLTHVYVKSAAFMIYIPRDLLPVMPQKGDRIFVVCHPVGAAPQCQYRATWAAAIPKGGSDESA